MLDLHCHLLPGIDDGATDLAMAMEMARMAVDDGIRTVACTPHIYPGLYDNDAVGIRRAIESLRREINSVGIYLELVEGADVHLDPGLLAGLREDRIPTLAGSRYVLLEPPHHTVPPRLEETLFDLMAAGYLPVITHPERLSWINEGYGMFERLVRRGCWIQVTAGAMTGRFGGRVRYWAERLAGEGLVHILATDAHHPRRRPPLLAEAREAAARLVGEDEATHMVETRPAGVISNVGPDDLPPALSADADRIPRKSAGGSRIRDLLGRLRGPG